MDTPTLLSALQEVEKRAERVNDANVIATYVDSGALVGALSSKDNGAIFGRRGTGKTHALKYLAETERGKKNFVAYIDMEQDTGSTEGRYVDQSLSIQERATRLLIDVLTIVHERLLEDAFGGRVNAQIDLLDQALNHFSEVLIVDQVTTTNSKSLTSGSDTGTSLNLTQDGVALALKDGTQVNSGASDSV